MKITAEDLDVLAEAIPDAMHRIADHAGRAPEVIRAMAERGKLGALFARGAALLSLW